MENNFPLEMPLDLEEVHVKSSKALNGLWYSISERLLIVEYCSGLRYYRKGLTQDWVDGLMAADSKGKYVQQERNLSAVPGGTWVSDL